VKTNLSKADLQMTAEDVVGLEQGIAKETLIRSNAICTRQLMKLVVGMEIGSAGLVKWDSAREIGNDGRLKN